MRILHLGEARPMVDFTRGKWQPFRYEPTVCFKRQMGRDAMMRDHFERLMEDAGRSGGSGGPFLK